MKRLISHFWYSRTQRNGILFLLLFIIFLQIFYFVLDFNSKTTIDSNRVSEIRSKLDSLSSVEDESQIFKMYLFNPNFITDFKGYQLGMSLEEIDRLHKFRDKGKYVNSVLEFQNITKVSDSLLKVISPYFKFPDWVTKQNKSKGTKIYYNPVKKSSISTTDINKATISDFESLSTINESLANRIVKYRDKLQGFYFKSQLGEVWKINEEQVDEIFKAFKIKSKTSFKKINVNTASFKEVLSVPYIDYELCKRIFQYRDEVAELQSIKELTNVEDFPMNLYDRIVLYLHAK